MSCHKPNEMRDHLNYLDMVIDDDELDIISQVKLHYHRLSSKMCTKVRIDRWVSVFRRLAVIQTLTLYSCPLWYWYGGNTRLSSNSRLRHGMNSSIGWWLSKVTTNPESGQNMIWYLEPLIILLNTCMSIIYKVFFFCWYSDSKPWRPQWYLWTQLSGVQ